MQLTGDWKKKIQKDVFKNWERSEKISFKKFSKTYKRLTVKNEIKLIKLDLSCTKLILS